jgi:glycosyltransferase involved in cell wall biosynthesis
MKFSILTPTHQREALLTRATGSLLAQEHTDWEMIIINDSPESDYSTFEQAIIDPRITYQKNERNVGVNASRNKALSLVSPDADFIILLDDDDYLAPHALQELSTLILNKPKIDWFVTNRAYESGKSLTYFPKNNTLYSYMWSYLIFKRGKGDATHTISTKLINKAHASFSHTVKQGEEWFFFYQIGLLSTMLYTDHNSTISDGYDDAHGLNFRKRTKKEYYTTLFNLARESVERKQASPLFFIYIFFRIIKPFFRL